MRQLDVYAGQRLVGYLGEDVGEGLSFSYDPDWLQSPDAVPLSPMLPLSSWPYRGRDVLSYFENLLPEGDNRNFIARAAQIAPENVFGMLERFGGDTAGAFSLHPHGQKPSSEPHYLPVTPEAIREWFANSRGVPLHVEGGEQARMSLSGAQDKMTVMIDESGGLSIPLGAAPSSHIIKPSVQHRNDVPCTAVNEALVMALARAVQLEVPEVRYSPELDAVLVARYDRAKGADGHLHRLHQNDLCQVMGITSGKKYEVEGGPSLKACVDTVMKHSAVPAQDKKRLIEWVAFNAMVGNMDSHAKNLSLLVGEDGRTRLSPFYDMVCTAVYPALSRKFAFKVGGENRPGWMMDRHWARFAAEIEVKPQLVGKLVVTVAERIENTLPEVAGLLRAQVQRPEDVEMIGKVEKEIQRATALVKNRCLSKDAEAEPEQNDDSPSPSD